MLVCAKPFLVKGTSRRKCAFATLRPLLRNFISTRIARFTMSAKQSAARGTPLSHRSDKCTLAKRRVYANISQRTSACCENIKSTQYAFGAAVLNHSNYHRNIPIRMLVESGGQVRRSGSIRWIGLRHVQTASSPLIAKNNVFTIVFPHFTKLFQAQLRKKDLGNIHDINSVQIGPIFFFKNCTVQCTLYAGFNS